MNWCVFRSRVSTPDVSVPGHGMPLFMQTIDFDKGCQPLMLVCRGMWICDATIIASPLMVIEICMCWGTWTCLSMDVLRNLIKSFLCAISAQYVDVYQCGVRSSYLKEVRPQQHSHNQTHVVCASTPLNHICIQANNMQENEAHPNKWSAHLRPDCVSTITCSTGPRV
jgi:hypothetical protein